MDLARAGHRGCAETSQRLDARTIAWWRSRKEFYRIHIIIYSVEEFVRARGDEIEKVPARLDVDTRSPASRES
jgi:hypothetical protein